MSQSGQEESAISASTTAALEKTLDAELFGSSSESEGERAEEEQQAEPGRIEASEQAEIADADLFGDEEEQFYQELVQPEELITIDANLPNVLGPKDSENVSLARALRLAEKRAGS